MGKHHRFTRPKEAHIRLNERRRRLAKHCWAVIDAIWFALCWVDVKAGKAIKWIVGVVIESIDRAHERALAEAKRQAAANAIPVAIEKGFVLRGYADFRGMRIMEQVRRSIVEPLPGHPLFYVTDGQCNLFSDGTSILMSRDKAFELAERVINGDPDQFIVAGRSYPDFKTEPIGFTGLYIVTDSYSTMYHHPSGQLVMDLAAANQLIAHLVQNGPSAYIQPGRHWTFTKRDFPDISSGLHTHTFTMQFGDIYGRSHRTYVTLATDLANYQLRVGVWSSHQAISGYPIEGGPIADLLSDLNQHIELVALGDVGAITDHHILVRVGDEHPSLT